MYDMVIIDSALFKKPFSEKALNFLKGKTIIISSSFYHEVEGYLRVLDNKRSETLRRNIAGLLKVTKNDACLTSSEAPFDIYSTAIATAKQGKGLCVMTEDLLLIERLCMELVPRLIIYDLNTDDHYRSNSEYLSKSCYAEHRQADSSTEVPHVFHMNSIVLRDSNNNSVTLANRLSDNPEQGDFGMEAAVYNVKGHPELVAKIYRHFPSEQKLNHLKKLKALSDEMHFSWCLLPQEILYRDSRPIGFTMLKKRVDMLSDDTLFLGNEQIIEDNRLALKRSYTLNFAQTLLAQIKVLNCYGLSVPDFNPNNFSTYYENSPVILFDTDSFILENYFGNAIDDTAFTRDYSYSDKAQLAQMTHEQALKNAFRLLSLGVNPRIRSGYPYIFSNPQSPVMYRRSYFPENVERYFEKVFTGRVDPSISIALYELTEAIEELHHHPEKDITVQQMIESALEKAEQTRAVNASDAADIKSQSANASDELKIPYGRVHTRSSTTPTYSSASSKKSKPKWFARAVVVAGLLFGIGYWLTSSGIIQF